MAGPNCSRIKMQDIVDRFGKLDGLTEEVAFIAATNLMNEKGYDDNTILSYDKRRELRQAVQDVINEIKLNKILEKRNATPFKIKGTEVKVSINKEMKSNDPVNHKDHIYIYSNNAQADRAVTGDVTPLDGVIAPKNGVTLNVNGSSATVRTTSTGEINKNAYGFVLKKNAQDEDGKFIGGEGCFTLEDREYFNSRNGAIAREIAKAARALNADGSPAITKAHIIESFGMERAGLPKELAEDFAVILEEELGIESSVELNEKYSDIYKKNYYGVVINNDYNKKKAQDRKDKKAEETKKLQEETQRSLDKKRPNMPVGDPTNAKVDLLAKIYPDIDARSIRVQLISSSFTHILSNVINLSKQWYESLADDDPDKDNYRDFYVGITSGNEAQQRIFALDNYDAFTGNGNLASLIFQEIQNSFKYIINVVSSDTYEEFIENLVNIANSDLTIEQIASEHTIFEINLINALRQNGIASNINYAKSYVKNIMNKWADEFEKILNTEGLFNALVVAAKDNLEFDENIRLTIDNSSTEKTAADIENDDDTGKVENRSGLNIVKYKLMDPSKSLSIRLKKLLGSLPRVSKNRKGQYYQIFDPELGMPLTVNAGYAYYILLNEFSEMRNEGELFTVLDRAIDKYAFLQPLKEKLQNDTDLRNEFYRAMRRTFNQTAVITSTGSLSGLNKSNSRESFNNAVQNNYESHIVLGTRSIYDENGECNTANRDWMQQQLTGVVRKDDKKGSVTKELYPMKWARWILQSPNQRSYTIENVLDALSILRGEYVKNGKTGNDMGLSLFDFLRNLGVDTNGIDLDNILPNITEEDIYALIEANPDMTEVEALNTLFTSDQRKNVLKIFHNMLWITNAKRGYRPGQDLVQNNSKNYGEIGASLPIISEGITQASYLFNNAQRFSYSPPSFIDKFVEIFAPFKNADRMTLEEYEQAAEQMKQTIEDQYGQYTFFKDANGNWNNTWLELLTNDHNIEFAKQIAAYNVLGINGGRSDATAIQDSREELWISLFLNFVKATDQNPEYAYYRTMPFSDTDALVLIKGPAYTKDAFNGTSWKAPIIDNISKVLRAEIRRIQDARNAADPNNTDVEKGSKVDRYEKNAFKFVNLPYFEQYKEELLDEYYSTDYDDIPELLHKWVTRMMEEKFGEFSSKLDDETYKTLYNKIMSLSDKKGSEEEDPFAEYPNDTPDLDPDLNKENDNYTDKKKSKEQLDAEQARKRDLVNYYLEKFYYNDFFAQTQLNQILFGDLAYAKNYDDTIKRNKQSYAAGERLYSLDENGNQLYDTAMFLEDIEEVAPSYENIEKLIDSTNQSETDKATARGIMYLWQKKITTTDGQSFRTLKSFRKLMKAAGGKWNDKLEKSYNNIISGTYTGEDLLVLVNSAKPFVFTHESRMVNGRNEKVNLQYKNSEYVLSAIYGALSCALTQSPVLIGLHKFMEAHDIDVVHFHSVVKIGYNNPFDLSDLVNPAQEAVADLREQIQKLKGELAQIDNDGITHYYTDYMGGVSPRKTLRLTNEINRLEGELDKALERESNKIKDALETQFNEMGEAKALHKTPLSDYMTMQPNDDHLLDTEAVFPSQLRNIISADLPSDFTMTIKIGNEDRTLNRDETVKFYNTLIADQLLDSFKLLNHRFTNIKALQRYLLNQARQNPKYGQDVINALQLNEEGTAFRLPFNSPNLSNKIEELLFSSFRNYITRQKINGGAAVLVSNFGLSKDLHIQWKEDGSIDYIPCYLPATMRKQLTDFLVERNRDGRTWYEIDFEKFKANADPELLDIIGSRIPTENKYSIMKLRIVGFMPISMGTTIMLPHEIITMSGTDFDIDKLFLMIKNIRRERVAAKELFRGYKKYLEDNNVVLSEAEQKAFDKLESLQRIYDGLTIKEIRSLEKASPELEKYTEEGDGFYQFYQYPQYKVLKVKHSEDMSLDDLSKLSDVKDLNLRKQLRDNMLIDVIGGILSTPFGSRQSLTPGNYVNLSKWSTGMRILNDPQALQTFIDQYGRDFLDNINEMSLEELDDFYEEYATVKDPNDIMQFIETHNNLMDGNSLIGATANISSTHFKYQFVPLEINPNNQFSILPRGAKSPIRITTLDTVKSPINGKLISDIIAEAQAAAPYNCKDPRLGYLGFTLKGIALPALLMRMGFDYDTIGLILNAQGLAKLGKELDEYTSGERNIHNFFIPDMNKIADLLIKANLGEEFTEDDLSYIAHYSAWFDNLTKIKKDVNMAKAISKRDSINNALGISTAQIIQEELAAEDFVKAATDATCSVQGLDKLVTTHLDIDSMTEEELRDKIMEAPLPRYQAFYTLGIDSAFSLAGRFIPSLQQKTYQALKMLRQQTRVPLTDPDSLATIKLFVSELPAFFLSKNSIFASDSNMTFLQKRNYYIHDFPAKMKAFLMKNDKAGKTDMQKLRNMTLIKNLSISATTGIILRGTSVKTSPRNRIKLQQELESIVFSSNPEIAQFGADLINYAYYNSGFNFGMSNYGNYISTIILEWVPTILDRLVNGNAEWTNSDGTLLDNYVKQFLLNHPSCITRIKVKPYEYINYETRDGENGTKQIKLPKAYINSLYKYGSMRSLVDYFKLFGRVYRKVPNINANGRERIYDTWYEECSVNKYKDKWNYTPFYDMAKDAADMDFTDMAERGRTGKVFNVKGGDVRAVYAKQPSDESTNDKAASANSDQKEQKPISDAEYFAGINEDIEKKNKATAGEEFFANFGQGEQGASSDELDLANMGDEQLDASHRPADAHEIYWADYDYAEEHVEASSALEEKQRLEYSDEEKTNVGVTDMFQQLYEKYYAGAAVANVFEIQQDKAATDAQSQAQKFTDFPEVQDDAICKPKK